MKLFRFAMPWQNVTVFVPPANDTLLSELIQEARSNGCWMEARNCPRVPPFYTIIL